MQLDTDLELDLVELVHRLADRSRARTEADVQSDLQTFLLYGGFNLHEQEVRLESQAGSGRRLDIEVGRTVIEVKKDLTRAATVEAAESQLGDYLQRRSREFGETFVGVLTDGAVWRLYYLDTDAQLLLAAELSVDPLRPAVDDLRLWLDGALATQEDLLPSAIEIRARLGATSSAFSLERTALESIYSKCRDAPEVRLKRELWARLLSTAFGTKFKNEDDLFVEHTYLVITAEVIAHAVAGLPIAGGHLSGSTLVSGELFEASDIRGVVERDFFDWVLDAPGGEAFVERLAKRLSRFRWSGVDHDILKSLYESVIDTETRHDLGEYYTPDWLAESLVDSSIDDATAQRILDPACGSGTFLFHAVRRFLKDADRAGMSNADALEHLSNQVIGVDLHPVAVTLARVTYLLAIGSDRLQRDRRSLSIPVYIGDSMQWQSEDSLLSATGITIYTSDGAELFSRELRFPAGVLADASRFDQLVDELANKASSRAPGSRPPSLRQTFARFAVAETDQAELTSTFESMCRLFDDGRDHIWGYYVRNLARPHWLAQPGNQVDVLVGNPPWLSYRFMTAEAQTKFKRQSQERGLWVGAQLTTHQDLSAYFVAKAVELYLRTGGRFSFVMPAGVLTRQQYAGFRSGSWSTDRHQVRAAFDQPADLRKIDCQPALFPVPCSVISGQRSEEARALGQVMEVWTAELPQRDLPLSEVSPLLRRQPDVPIPDITALESPYSSRFTQGAFVWPRMLLVVEDDDPTPLGTQAGRRRVRSARTSKEKPPWKDVPSLLGSVEEQFVRPLRLGATIAPFVELEAELAIIPWDGTRLISKDSAELDRYPGLAKWWEEAERLWAKHRPDYTTGDLTDRLQYKEGTSKQMPIAPHRVVYTSSGTNLVAARLTDQRSLVSETLYWAACQSEHEAKYLVAILNSEALLSRIKELQSEGQFGRRHFHKVVFAAGLPLFEPANPLHVELAAAGGQAESLAADLGVAGVAFQQARKRVREAFYSSDLARRIDEMVKDLLRIGAHG
ncbi:MAG: SAM-dependent DNA methyltransferase [Microthrixaceae bacterium]|nr:SAM-dependent DNA methyltransferase [Microthrixaceae bacterium]